MKHLVCYFLSVTAFSHAAGPLDWLKPDALDPERTSKIKEDLNLTSEQETRVQSLITEARTSSAELITKLKQEQDTFDKLLRKPNTTAEDGVAALRKMVEAETAIKEQQLRTILSVRDLLTPEQRRLAMTVSEGRKMEPAADTPFGAKANRIKQVIEGLGIPPTDALKEAGAAIEALVQEGKLAEAEASLDKFIIENKADDPDDGQEPAFDAEEPGATDTDTLGARRDEVVRKAQRVTSIPLLRKLAKAKTALDTAISNQDAQAVGRILTWVEKQLAEK
jgi:Spy/CpxP family protein refolding chaperone